jgi:ABC-type multidrug transport system permease subunit
MIIKQSVRKQNVYMPLKKSIPMNWRTILFNPYTLAFGFLLIALFIIAWAFFI